MQDPEMPRSPLGRNRERPVSGRFEPGTYDDPAFDVPTDEASYPGETTDPAPTRRTRSGGANARRARAAERLDDAGPVDRTLELREEELVPHKEMRDVGEAVVRTEVEELPGRVEVDALRQEVQVEHEPVGRVVSERVPPWEEEDSLVVPVYEEQLVVVKRLVLREQLRIRRVSTTERRVFEDTLRRDRAVIEDPSNSGLVVERYPTDEEPVDRHADDRRDGGADRSAGREEGGLLGSLRRVLQ